ncbi:MAG: TVP38/TMEM64 family protein [Gemmatimonadetes bacterium]|nr:VTT domain-containing protein [Gemmatimonadota bacterium]NNM05330.1 TVP38/TMEM64 family protein [Gemmatimonadota bacterium]
MEEARTGFKRKTFIVWIVVVAVVLTLYLTNQDRFDVNWIRGVVHDNRFLIIPFYLLLLSLLGLTFIPSTPFAIAGVVLFDPTLAYFLNLLGIVSSSTIVYHFAGFLGLREAFETKYPEKLSKVRNALDRKELPIIIGWSFFPVVPTDLIIYVASTLKIPLWKCLLGVLIGEGALNAFYIFSVGAAM